MNVPIRRPWYARILMSRLRNRMTVMALFLALVPLFLVIFASNSLFSAYIQKNAMSQLELSNIIISERLRRLEEEIDSITTRIIISDLVQKSLMQPLSDTETVSMTRFLKSYDSTCIDSLLYLDNQNNTYDTTLFLNLIPADRIIASKAVEELAPTYAKSLWSFQPDDLFLESTGDQLFVARYVRHLNLNVKPGILVVKVKSKALEDVIGHSDLMNDSTYFLMDRNGTIAYTQNTWEDQVVDNQLGADIKLFVLGEPRYDIGRIIRPSNIVLYSTNLNTGWSVVSVISYRAINSGLKKLQLFTSLILAAAAVMAVFAALFFARRFTHPIGAIVAGLRDFQGGNMAARLSLRSHDEFELIGQSFNSMTESIQDLLETIRKDQVQMKEAELNSMIHQINPHFIYNTLDNIRMLSRLSGDRKTSDLILSLSKFLRISLSKGQSIIRMEDEFEHARSYLLIQKMRYEGLFDFHVYLEPEVARCHIVKFVLQPFIENSITHGFHEMDSGGWIYVTGDIQGDRVRLVVTDNGKGIDPSILVRLNGYMKDEHLETQYNCQEGLGGYGIRNVVARLRLYYGEGVNLVFMNQECGGSICTISIDQRQMSESVI